MCLYIHDYGGFRYSFVLLNFPEAFVGFPLCLRVTSGSILFLTQHFRSFFRIYQNLNIDPSIPLPVHLQQPASQSAWPPARRALDPITQLAFFYLAKLRTFAASVLRGGAGFLGRHVYPRSTLLRFSWWGQSCSSSAVDCAESCTAGGAPHISRELCT